MKKNSNSGGSDGEFPLAAYIAVYDWIETWVEAACDPQERVIALAAFHALTSVGVLIQDIMQQMADEMETLHGSNAIH